MDVVNLASKPLEVFLKLQKTFELFYLLRPSEPFIGLWNLKFCFNGSL